MKLFDSCRMKSSFADLLFYIVFKKQSKYKHQSVVRWSSTSVMGPYSEELIYNLLAWELIERVGFSTGAKWTIYCNLLSQVYVSGRDSQVVRFSRYTYTRIHVARFEPVQCTRYMLFLIRYKLCLQPGCVYYFVSSSLKMFLNVS